MQTIDVVIRRNTDTKPGQLELFYSNAYESRPYWWIECFSPLDGHNEVSRHYMQRRTKRVDGMGADVLALIKKFQFSPAHGGAVLVRPVARLCGPKGLIYGGE